MKILLGITGATGICYGIRLLEILKETEHHVTLVMSPWAEKNVVFESNVTVEDIKAMADTVCDYDDLSAPAASGSHGIDAVIIAPCSMKTLSAVANGYSDKLIVRSADVALKERRPLLLMARETPFTAIHL